VATPHASPARGSTYPLAAAAGVVGSAALVFACAAALLGGADAIGAALLEPRFDTFVSVADAERAFGRPLPIPAYYPARYRWPPAAIHIGDATAVLEIDSAADGRQSLFVVQRPASTSRESIERLLPPMISSEESRIAVRGTPAGLGRARGTDGAVWTRLGWTHGDTTFEVIARGSDADLPRMAGSIAPPEAR
jgi:hypothetical protein